MINPIAVSGAPFTERGSIIQQTITIVFTMINRLKTLLKEVPVKNMRNMDTPKAYPSARKSVESAIVKDKSTAARIFIWGLSLWIGEVPSTKDS